LELLFLEFWIDWTALRLSVWIDTLAFSGAVNKARKIAANSALVEVGPLSIFARVNKCLLCLDCKSLSRLLFRSRLEGSIRVVANGRLNFEFVCNVFEVISDNIAVYPFIDP